MEEPSVVSNYQELLEHPNSLPLFYDQIAKVSPQFKHAPNSTLRGRIWSKLVQAKKDTEYIMGGKSDTSQLTGLARKAFRLMSDEHHVLIASTLTINMLKTFYCGSSPENEFWRLSIFSDESEEDQLVGYPLSNFYPEKELFVNRIRRLSHSHIIIKFLKWAMDATNFAFLMAGTTQQHRYKQLFVCSDEFEPEKDTQGKSITTDYYFTFFQLTFVIYGAAFLAYFCERFCRKKSVKKRKQRRINYYFNYLINYYREAAPDHLKKVNGKAGSSISQ